MSASVYEIINKVKLSLSFVSRISVDISQNLIKSDDKIINDARENDEDAKRPKVGYDGTRNTDSTSPRSLATQTLNKLKTFSIGNDDGNADSLLSQTKGIEEMSTYSSE
ncbi:unnamed protein product, partial [Timema podura]|nr:unnamed protein product [Timema podura]